MRGLSVRLALGAGLCVFLLTACAKTMVNSGPSSVAPAISWVVRVVDTNDSKTLNGSGSMSVPRSTVQIFIHAKSPSGVKSVSDGTFVDATFTCISGNLGQTAFATFAGATQTQTPDAQNNVVEDLVLFQVFGLNHTCSPGFSFTGGSMNITAKAINFGGKVTTATLKLSIQ